MGDLENVAERVAHHGSSVTVRGADVHFGRAIGVDIADSAEHSAKAAAASLTTMRGVTVRNPNGGSTLRFDLLPTGRGDD
jgi:hypothetical protein